MKNAFLLYSAFEGVLVCVYISKKKKKIQILINVFPFVLYSTF